MDSEDGLCFMEEGWLVVGSGGSVELMAMLRVLALPAGEICLIGSSCCNPVWTDTDAAGFCLQILFVACCRYRRWVLHLIALYTAGRWCVDPEFGRFCL